MTCSARSLAAAEQLARAALIGGGVGAARARALDRAGLDGAAAVERRETARASCRQDGRRPSSPCAADGDEAPCGAGAPRAQRRRQRRRDRRAASGAAAGAPGSPDRRRPPAGTSRIAPDAVQVTSPRRDPARARPGAAAARRRGRASRRRARAARAARVVARADRRARRPRRAPRPRRESETRAAPTAIVGRARRQADQARPSSYDSQPTATGTPAGRRIAAPAPSARARRAQACSSRPVAGRRRATDAHADRAPTKSRAISTSSSPSPARRRQPEGARRRAPRAGPPRPASSGAAGTRDHACAGAAAGSTAEKKLAQVLGAREQRHRHRDVKHDQADQVVVDGRCRCPAPDSGSRSAAS